MQGCKKTVCATTPIQTLFVLTTLSSDQSIVDLISGSLDPMCASTLPAANLILKMLATPFAVVRCFVLFSHSDSSRRNKTPDHPRSFEKISLSPATPQKRKPWVFD